MDQASRISTMSLRVVPSELKRDNQTRPIFVVELDPLALSGNQCCETVIIVRMKMISFFQSDDVITEGAWCSEKG